MDEKLDQLKAEIEGWFDTLSANYPGYSFTAEVNETINQKISDGMQIQPRKVSHEVIFHVKTVES